VAHERSAQAEELLNIVGRIVLTAGVVILPASLIMGKVFFGLGIFVALLWNFINLYFLAYVLRAVLSGGSGTSGLPFLLVIKFPLLYAAAFFVLRTGYFPVESIIAGMTLFLVVLFLGVLRIKE